MTTPAGSPGPDGPPPPHDGPPHTPAGETTHRLEESRAWNVVSSLITGPAMFGAIGYGVDHLLGTTWLVAVGILGGMALSLYLVWVRYGTQ